MPLTNGRLTLSDVLSVSRFCRLRGERLTYGQIGELPDVQYSEAAVRAYGKRVLPADLRSIIVRTSIVDLLSPKQLAELRSDGLSYSEIGEMVGRSEATVSNYARRVLVREERGHTYGTSKAREVNRCNCGLPDELANPVDDESTCWWCRLEQMGESLHALFMADLLPVLEMPEATSEAYQVRRWYEQG